jgi:N-acetylmuramoyl-L-alanine amidase
VEKLKVYTVCSVSLICIFLFGGLLYGALNYDEALSVSAESFVQPVIVIDAGHGGSENGAIGCLGDKEKLLNLDVALKLKKILEAHNFDVYLTRETDCFLSLNDRVKFAQDKDALIFISIHLNSVPISDDPNLNRGSIVFYFNPQSKNLAKSLSKTISQDLKTVDGGSSQASYAVIRPTEYIGALVELAYLVNPQDVAIYKSKKFAKISAMAIYKGLANYIHTELEK